MSIHAGSDRSGTTGARTLRYPGAVLLGLLLLAGTVRADGAPSAETAAVSVKSAGGSLAADTAWEGRLLVESIVTVEVGATLTVRPGTEIRFATAGGLIVAGVLLAEGTADKPVFFIPAAADQEPWAGIALGEAPGQSLLRFCRIAGAQAVSITGGEHRIEKCDIADGVTGITMEGTGPRPVIIGNRIAGMSAMAIQCLAKSAPLIEDNVIEHCGHVGISANPGSQPVIRGNRISNCESAIELSQVPPRISGNTITDCSRGIVLTSVSGGEPVRGNRLERNAAGILCEHYSDPEISGNTVVRNGDGVVCFMGSRPRIRANDILGNERGLLCDQFADPDVSANTIAGNRCAIYLHHSSYPAVRGNNIIDNDVHVELGYMSRDWERHSDQKPMRGRSRQLQEQAGRGGAANPRGATGDPSEIVDRPLDLSGNWWGESTTREMQQKGTDANISTFKDGHDPRPYESKYQQDKIVYAPWAKERFAATGVPPPASAPPASSSGP